MKPVTVMSCNLLDVTDLQVPEDVIIRINCAWMPDLAKLLAKMERLFPRKIFMDYPTGRSKLPKTGMTLEEVIAVACKSEQVVMFARSNVEYPEHIHELRGKLPGRISIVPKIETVIGALNIDAICKAGIQYIMLDKEDLATSCKGDARLYQECVERITRVCAANHVVVLNMSGVVFVG